MPICHDLKVDLYRLAWCILYEMGAGYEPKEFSSQSRGGTNPWTDWAVDLRSCGCDDTIKALDRHYLIAPNMHAVQTIDNFWRKVVDKKPELIDRGLLLLDTV